MTGVRRSTADLACAAVERLRDGGVVLGDGHVDYAAADLLESLVDLDGTKQTPLDLERVHHLREFLCWILAVDTDDDD